MSRTGPTMRTSAASRRDPCPRGASGSKTKDSSSIRSSSSPVTGGSARFGDGVFAPNGSLDRGALAALVFPDETALRDLEAIVHPAVRARLDGSVAGAERAGATVIAIEAIKLVEGGLAVACDEVWLVACEGATQRARLAARGADPGDVEQRIAAQGDIVARLAPVATRVLFTDGSLEATLAAVDAALAEALARRGQGAG